MLLDVTPHLVTFAEALVTFGIIIGTVVINKLITWFTTKKQKRHSKSSTDQLIKDVAAMKAELSPNGGSSMKDVLNKTHLQVEEQSKQISELQSSYRTMRAQQRARLELQLNNNPDCIMLFNEDGECTFANKACLRLFGMSKEDMLYYKWLKAIENQKEKQEVDAAWDYSVKNQISFNMQYTVRNQQTKIITKIEATTDPIWDDEGNPMWFYSTLKVVG